MHGSDMCARRCSWLSRRISTSAYKVEMHNSLRGQEKRAGREEVVVETYAVPRGQETPPPGGRLARLGAGSINLG